MSIIRRIFHLVEWHVAFLRQSEQYIQLPNPFLQPVGEGPSYQPPSFILFSRSESHDWASGIFPQQGVIFSYSTFVHSPNTKLNERENDPKVCVPARFFSYLASNGWWQWHGKEEGDISCYVDMDISIYIDERRPPHILHFACQHRATSHTQGVNWLDSKRASYSSLGGWWKFNGVIII